MVVFISEEEIETLKAKIAEKDEKLKNQASELNHLTNEIIPELKKENKKLKALKVELTDVLETSTKKYFNQLEINADLSESVAKKGAGLQLAKVRLEEIEKLVVELEAKANENEVDLEAIDELSDEEKSIINDLNNEIDQLNKELDAKDRVIDNKEKEIRKKQNQLKDKNSEIADLKDNLIPKLKAESAELTAKIKANQAAYDEEKAGVGGKIAKLEAEIKDLNTKLDNKKRDYDKLSTTLNGKDKTINSLKNKNQQLTEQLKEESNKGFFSKIRGR
jgi:chromosome segregation ATPase